MRTSLLCVAVFALLCASCGSGGDDAPDAESDDTTIERFDGACVTLTDVRLTRKSAESVALVTALLDRELREPWAETRNARLLLEHVRARAPAEYGLAEDRWALSEPLPSGQWRAPFGEIGFYEPTRRTLTLHARPKPASLEALAEMLLARQSDDSARGRMASCWRRFAPEVCGRRRSALASSWVFFVSSDAAAELKLRDSLLGPFLRTDVVLTRESTAVGEAVLDGYSGDAALLDLVRSGRESPVAATVDALDSAVAGGEKPLPVEIEGGFVRVRLSDEDRTFLAAALRGLRDGVSEVAYIPLACGRFQASFDYLVGRAEARAAFEFELGERGWVLVRFEYEPAATSLYGTAGAKLDLMPLVRALPEASSAVDGLPRNR